MCAIMLLSVKIDFFSPVVVLVKLLIIQPYRHVCGLTVDPTSPVPQVAVQGYELQLPLA